MTGWPLDYESVGTAHRHGLIPDFHSIKSPILASTFASCAVELSSPSACFASIHHATAKERSISDITFNAPIAPTEYPHISQQWVW